MSWVGDISGVVSAGAAMCMKQSQRIVLGCNLILPLAKIGKIYDVALQTERFGDSWLVSSIHYTINVHGVWKTVKAQALSQGF